MTVRPRRMALLVALASVLLVACTDSSGGGAPSGTILPPAPSMVGGRTSTGNGVSFEYPAGWKTFEQPAASASSIAQAWSRTVGLDGRNLVSVAEYSLSISITRQTIDSRAEWIRSQLDDLFARAAGSVTSGPTRLEMGGLPAVAFTGTAHDPSGHVVRERLVLAFDGSTEYFVNCQYDDAAEREILAGCDRVVSTFRVTG